MRARAIEKRNLVRECPRGRGIVSRASRDEFARETSWGRVVSRSLLHPLLSRGHDKRLPEPPGGSAKAVDKCSEAMQDRRRRCH